MPEEPQDNEQQPEANPSSNVPLEETELLEPGPEEPLLESPKSVPELGPRLSQNPVIEPVLSPFPTEETQGESLVPGQVSPQFDQPVSEVVIADPKPSWFKKNKSLVLVGAATALVVILSVSAFAITSWYQNPKKVISDSIINAFTSKTAIYSGEIDVENKDMKVAVDITSKLAGATGSMDAKVTVTVDKKEYSLNGSALFDKSGDLYFKVEHLAGLVAEAKSRMAIPDDSSLSKAVDKLVAKIDGTWVKVSSSDLKQYSQETADAKNCVNETITKFKEDKAAIAEISDLYNKNPFIVVDKNLGQEGGSFGYQIKSDNSALKEFKKGLEGAKIYKYLNDCDKTFDIATIEPTSDTESANGGTFKLWVDVWSHQITKIEASSNDDGTKVFATILPKFNQKVTISAPTSSITLAQLQTYISEMFTSLQSGS